jgi:hypothetical protein
MAKHHLAARKALELTACGKSCALFAREIPKHGHHRQMALNIK